MTVEQERLQTYTATTGPNLISLCNNHYYLYSAKSLPNRRLFILYRPPPTSQPLFMNNSTPNFNSLFTNSARLPWSEAPRNVSFSQPNVPSLFAPISDTPTVHETLALLKLWRAVAVVKQHLCGDSPTVWPLFVAWALRRFALFAAALTALKNPKLHVLPPLDIAWVWHSLLVAPEACFAMFARSGLSEFLDISFPLNQIADCIDSSFCYFPDKLGVHNFHGLMANYGKGYSLSYDIGSFNPEEVFPIYCPVSKNLLAQVSLSHFVCSSFLVRSQEGVVTHHSLARRQSDADHKLSINTPEWPNFSSPGTPDTSTPPSPLSSCLLPVSLKSPFESALPLLHLTIEEDCLQILGDWIDHLALSPVQNMVDAENWIFHPNMHIMLAAAVKRYSKFWKLFSRSPAGQVPVPTLDIRLVWYAHMARFKEYADFSLYHSKSIVVPPRSGSQTTQEFKTTAALYQKRFHTPYCPCGHLDGSLAYARDTCTLSCYRHVYELLAPSYDQ